MIFDSHLHIIPPGFPLTANNGYLPPYFSVEDYRAATDGLGVVGGAVVSGSFQGFDQTYLLHVLNKLGPAYVGVTQIQHTVSDDELHVLHRAGIRAVRFNIKRGGPEMLDRLEEMAGRVYQMFGWHVELYVDSADLPELETRLLKLPRFSIDHLGLSKKGLDHLYALAEKGCRIKATGFGRVDFDPLPVMKQIHGINPKALMFGTDLPSTRAPVPFHRSDVKLITDHFDETQSSRILYQNAQLRFNSENAPRGR